MLNFALLLLVAQPSPPTVLIYQQLAPGEGTGDLNIRWASNLAQLLSEQGKVRPVVWSLSDPTVRKWADDRTVEFVDPITTEALLSAGKKVDASFVLVISGLKSEGGQSLGALLMYRPGSNRPVWTDTKQFAISGGPESAGLTFANTWATKLAEGPWKNFKAGMPIEVPKDPVQDPVGKTKPPVVAPPVVADSNVAIQQSEDQARKGLIAEAILTLREAIDENPTDPRPRGALVKLYADMGRNEEAAGEAERLAGLSLDGKGFLAAAAEMWLDVGKPAEAQNALNEHKARAGETAETQLIQARIWLAQDQLAKANDAFQASSDSHPSADAALGMAVVAAMQGQDDLVKMYLSDIKKLPAAKGSASYRWAMKSIDARMDLFAEQFREVMRYATAKPNEPQTLARAAKIESIARSMNTLMEGLVSPNNHSASHERRRLAHKLLVQAATECGNYARNGEEDTGAEANLSFGEALRQLPLAREAMLREIVGK